MRECYVDRVPHSQHNMCITCYVDATVGTTVRSTSTSTHGTPRTVPRPIFPLHWPRTAPHVLYGGIDFHTPSHRNVLVLHRLGRIPLHHHPEGCHNHFRLRWDLFCRVYRADHPSLFVCQLSISYPPVQPLVVYVAHCGALRHRTLSLGRGKFPRTFSSSPPARSERSRRLEGGIRTLHCLPRSATQRWVKKEHRKQSAKYPRISRDAITQLVSSCSSSQ